MVMMTPPDAMTISIPSAHNNDNDKASINDTCLLDYVHLAVCSQRESSVPGLLNGLNPGNVIWTSLDWSNNPDMMPEIAP